LQDFSYAIFNKNVNLFTINNQIATDFKCGDDISAKNLQGFKQADGQRKHTPQYMFHKQEPTRTN